MYASNNYDMAELADWVSCESEVGVRVYAEQVENIIIRQPLHYKLLRDVEAPPEDLDAKYEREKDQDRAEQENEWHGSLPRTGARREGGNMARNLLWLLVGLVLGFLFAVAMKSHEFRRLNAANRAVASQLESAQQQLESERHQLESQKQITESATATIRMATEQLRECDQALHRGTTKRR